MVDLSYCILWLHFEPHSCASWSSLKRGNLETLAEFGSTQPVSIALSTVDAESRVNGELWCGQKTCCYCCWILATKGCFGIAVRESRKLYALTTRTSEETPALHKLKTRKEWLVTLVAGPLGSFCKFRCIAECDWSFHRGIWEYNLATDFLNGMMGTVLKFEPLFCGDPWMDVLVQGHMTNDSFTRKQDNLHSTGRMIHLYLSCFVGSL